MEQPKVYVVLVNYNRWQDTVECLESLLKSDYANFHVIVVENGSENDSIDCLKKWAAGDLPSPQPSKPELIGYVSPPSKKPLPLSEYAYLNGVFQEKEIAEARLSLVRVTPNRGFAYGNNIGLKFALSKGDFDYVWSLNNDTVVTPSALSELVATAQEARCSKRKIGMIGCKLFYYYHPSVFQGVGGRFNRLFALSKHVGAFQKDDGQYDHAAFKMDYVMGASMLVSKAFLEEVGLMAEDYIVYFEEMDWAERGKAKGWGLGFCPKSVVYHKEGGTVGSPADPRKRSDFADYYCLRNRFVFTKRFYPMYLPFVYCSMFAVLLRRLQRKKYGMAKRVLQMLLLRELL